MTICLHRHVQSIWEGKPGLLSSQKEERRMKMMMNGVEEAELWSILIFFLWRSPRRRRGMRSISKKRKMKRWWCYLLVWCRLWLHAETITRAELVCSCSCLSAASLTAMIAGPMLSSLNMKGWTLVALCRFPSRNLTGYDWRCMRTTAYHSDFLLYRYLLITKSTYLVFSV